MHTHDDESGRDHRQGDTEENTFLGDDGQRPGLFPHPVELFALKSQGIERVQQISGHHQSREHGKHNAKRQGLCKALHCAGPQQEQYARGDQRGDVAVDDGGKRLVKTDFYRVAHSLARCQFFADTCKDNHICVHRHTDGQDDARHAR